MYACCIDNNVHGVQHNIVEACSHEPGTTCAFLAVYRNLVFSHPVWMNRKMNLKYFQTVFSLKVEEVYLDPARIAAMKMERLQREKAEVLQVRQESSSEDVYAITI